MADFCKQCTDYMFPPGYPSDFEWVKDHITEEEDKQGLGIAVLCEGCGYIVVNRAGECVSPHCKLHGDKKE